MLAAALADIDLECNIFGVFLPNVPSGGLLDFCGTGRYLCESYHVFIYDGGFSRRFQTRRAFDFIGVLTCGEGSGMFWYTSAEA